MILSHLSGEYISFSGLPDGQINMGMCQVAGPLMEVPKLKILQHEESNVEECYKRGRSRRRPISAVLAGKRLDAPPVSLCHTLPWVKFPLFQKKS